MWAHYKTKLYEFVSERFRPLIFFFLTKQLWWSRSGCNSFFFVTECWWRGCISKVWHFCMTVNTRVAGRLWSWCFHLLSCVLLWVCGGLFTGVRHDSSRMWWESVWNRKHSGSFCSLISPSFDFNRNPSEWRSVPR